MDHDGRSIGVGVGGQPRRAQRNQPVCPPSVGVERIGLSRHRGYELGRALDRSDHDRALSGRELGLEAEPPPLFEVPPREGSSALGIPFLLDLRVEREVCPASDRAARHVLRPPQQVALGLGSCEAAQLDDLVDPELSAREGVGGTR